MDVYGYSAYRYNQSDELAKQMFAQQTLASTNPYNRPPEPHTMPPPSGAPWNVEGMPWGMSSRPSVVQFTGQQPIDPKFTSSPVVHCKRKSLDVEPTIPAKQLITEEKMAAHLNGLHISSDFKSHKLAIEDTMDVGMEPIPSTSTDTSCPVLITDKFKGHTIVLSDEVKKVHEEPLLPAALMERLEKPRMSLVLWKPKEEILKVKEEKEQEKVHEHNKKRNGILVTEPGMDVEM